MKQKRPDVKTILRGLKDFQRDTVEYVFQRLFLDADSTRRMLVADEVGLGKTLVARGVVARAIDHLWGKVDRIDIVYICSNASIAHQNINRLNITGEEDFEIASRITLLPTVIKDLKHRKLNFISFTPGTSFDLKSSLGRKEERALLYWLLDRAWELRGAAPFNILQGNVDHRRFRDLVHGFEVDHDIDETLAERFSRSLDLHIRRQQEDGVPGLRSQFDDLCGRFRRVRKYIPHEDLDARRILVGELRTLLASTCLNALEPDLVILDEFQRFRYLLDGTDEASGLARGFFEHPDVRILLLSATPYKMLTVQEDRDEGEDHYVDFIKTVRFLQNEAQSTEQFEQLLEHYRLAMLRLGPNGTDELRTFSHKLEGQLRRVVVRTEKLASSEDRNGMLQFVPPANLGIQSKEALSYLKLQKIARVLDHPDTIEYWKSAPYLLNFMDRYELKKRLENAIGSDDEKVLRKLLKDSPDLLLSPADVSAYTAIDPGNARLRYLIGEVVDKGLWRLLWLPPSLPYYALGGPYASANNERVTKRLVFSAWRMVPKVIASLLSYEVERRIFSSLEPHSKNTPEARKRRRPLLRFAFAGGRLTGMPILSLLYPCLTLAKKFDPLAMALTGRSSSTPLNISEVISQTSQRLTPLLKQIGAERVQSGPEDDAWYWAAPILLDLKFHRKPTRKWFAQEDLPDAWSGSETPGDEEGEKTRWSDHVNEAKMLVEGKFRALGRAPSNLSEVLAHVALASPSVVSLRSLNRVCRGPSTSEGEANDLHLQNHAGMIAWAFLRLFNLPEVTALLRGMNREEPYWMRVLEYCVNGCLQATLDEYLHVLKESLGLLTRPLSEMIEELTGAVHDALTLRTVNLSVDYLSSENGRLRTGLDGPGMRCHFSLRFGEDQSEEERELVRTGQVRAAFNSPFWPFVLATTSVGQEGLDFHSYCHAVVHWNLPANPVDLEQREGRIHRYKGHAIRKNLALRYRLGAVDSYEDDPWDSLFDTAARKRPEGSSDIVPYWVFDAPGGAKIERHVPAVPLSREEFKLEALRRSLAVYRMVFGQIRQDDLVSFLLSRFGENEIHKLVREIQIDLSPPQSNDRS